MKTNYDLRKDVMDEIGFTPELRSVDKEIEVAVKDGVVTLSGEVDSYWKKVAAEEAAQRVTGVRVVASDLVVKVSGPGRTTDTEIAEAVRNALRWNSEVNHDQIELKVEAGWVYMAGKVDWLFEKESAQRTVERVFGVVGVNNSIILKPRPVDENRIKGKIRAAYNRSATLDAESIYIETSGGTITLFGSVSSCAERKEAESIAYASPGVTNVVNRIEIESLVLAQ
jgi:osmotically-inducible protein OsmY